MITRLEVDGFKSLRNFAVDLEPFTVLVGPNDAGKSNILEALALVARLGRISSPEDALKQGRGRASEQFSRHHSDTAQTISLGLECLELENHAAEHDDVSTPDAKRLRYEITLQRSAQGHATERIRIEKTARNIAEATDRWMTTHPEWGSIVTPPPSAERVFQFSPFFKLIQLDAAHMREASDPIDTGDLAPDASNLPSVLAALSDIELGRIRATLVGLIPGITDFDIKTVDDSLHLEFRSREGDRVPARLASDGTLRALGLLTAVLAHPRSWNTIVCIEEPENGIYPGRLSRLIDTLRAATDSTQWRDKNIDTPPPQVILTTHSLIALDALRHHRDSIRFIDTVWRDGIRSTRARRIVEDAALTDRMTEASVREIELRLRSTGNAEER